MTPLYVATQLVQQLRAAVALVGAAFQLLGSIMVRPSAWQHLVQSIDPALSSGFCLLYLHRETFRNRTLRRILLLGFGVLPLFLVIVEQILRYLATTEPLTLQILGTNYLLNGAAKFAGMLRIGGILAIFFSVGAGIVAMVADIIVNEAIHQYFFFFMEEQQIHSTTSNGYVQSYPGLCIAIFSFCVGFSTFAHLQALPQSPRHKTRSIGPASLGIILSLIFATAELLALKKFNLRATTLLAAAALIAFSGIVAISSFLGGLSWQRGFWRCLGLLLVYALIMFVGSWIGKLLKPGETATTIAGAVELAHWGGLRAVITNCLLLLLIAPAVIAEWLGGAGAAAAAGGIVAPLCWLCITIFTDKEWELRRYTEQRATISLAVVCIAIGLSGAAWWRYLFYPFEAAWNRMLFQLDQRKSGKQKSCIHWHSAFWDERQTLRSDGLVEHLVLVTNRWPGIGPEIIERVSAGPQRWAARAAQFELELQALEQCQDIAELSRTYQRFGALAMHGSGMDALRAFSRLSQDFSSAMAQSNPHHHRIALRIAEEHMDRLELDWRLSGELLAARYLRILYAWRQLLMNHQVQLQREAEQSTATYIESPYVIGLPLSEHQHVFVGRGDAVAQIEKLIMSPTAPPLLLYGQRRMGKTSLLRNLRRLLPSAWITLFVDLQIVASVSGHPGLLFQLARAMASQLASQLRSSLEPPTLADLEREPFVVFDVWLDRLVEQLRDQNALLLLDEFEQLDVTLRRGTLDPHLVLGMLRHVIQHKPRFRILVAGSHTFAEASNWSSYLINTRIIKLGCLHRNESRQLIEAPIPGFPLRYAPSALEEVLALTGGHPYLLQLLCERVVTLKNQQDERSRFLATRQDVESAVEPALSEASFFFPEIANQISPEGLGALQSLAQRGRGAEQRVGEMQPLPIREEMRIWGELEMRDLVDPTARGYRFQIELFRRYFARK